jgi:outer membrane protein assembly factor BamB
MIVVISGPTNLQTRALNQLVGCVYAINISNGHIVWADKFPNQIMTEPIIVNGEVIIGLGNAMFINSTIRGTGENVVLALSLYSGKESCNFTTLGEECLLQFTTTG